MGGTSCVGVCARFSSAVALESRPAVAADVDAASGINGPPVAGCECACPLLDAAAGHHRPAGKARAHIAVDAAGLGLDGRPAALAAGHSFQSDEVERRDSRQLDQRLRRASFESLKTLEDLDWRFNPKLPKDKLLELGTCQFVARKEVVLLCGPSGTGKSHLAQALGHRACRCGHSVLYTTAHHFFISLRAARADGSYDRQMLRYTGVELLILDDLSLRPLSSEEAMDLYELIRLRYERGALLCTSNRAAAEWGSLFGDALLASAAMDRLLHHAHLVVMDGPWYRTQRTGKRKAGSADEKQEAAS